MVKLIVLLVTSFVFVTVSGAMLTTDAEAELTSSASARVLSYTRHQAELHFEVISNGCTKPSDFMLEFDDGEASDRIGHFSTLAIRNDMVYLRLIRVKADGCRRRPMSYTVTFPVPTMAKQKQIYLVNRFVPTTRFNRGE